MNKPLLEFAYTFTTTDEYDHVTGEVEYQIEVTKIVEGDPMEWIVKDRDGKVVELDGVDNEAIYEEACRRLDDLENYDPREHDKEEESE